MLQQRLVHIYAKNFTEISADCFRGNNLWYQEYTKMNVFVFIINFSCSAI